MLLRFVTGVLIGGIAVAGFFFFSNLGDNEPDPVAAPTSTTFAGVTTTAATTTTEASWVKTGEARFESTVVLPKAMSVDDGVATLEYELATLGPMRPESISTFHGPVGAPPEYGPVGAQPEEWLLVIGSESVEGTPSVSDTAVRFDVPDTASLDDVVEVRLVRWRVAMPFHHVCEMPLVSGETMLLPDGASITVRHVLEQKSETIFQFDTRRPDGFQLASEDPVAPASVLLRYTRPMWMPVDGDIVVWEGEHP